ncbi:MAG: BACON domain-containing protein [Phocaeicola sp.]
MIRKCMYLVICLFCLFACKKESESIIGEITLPEGATEQFDFFAEGGTGSLSFNSAHEWTASTEVDWLTLSPASGGAGEFLIELEVAQTDEPREAIVVIESFGVSREIKVNQSRYPVKNNFEVAYTSLTLENYKDGKFEWQLVLKDADYHTNYGSKGSAIFLKLLLDKDWDYSKGIPFGLYNLEETQNIGTALGVITANYNDKMLESGLVELIKGENGLKIGLLAVDSDGNKFNTFYDVPSADSYMFNNAYGSTISKDLYITNYTQCFVEDEGDIYREGKKMWRLNMSNDDIQLKYIGDHQGSGEWLTLTLVTPLDATTPAGKYDFVEGDRVLIDYTVIAGYRSTFANGIGFYSWWKKQSESRVYTEEAPFVAGTVEIIENSDGTYSVDILAVDDALPETNSLIVKYAGKLDIYDKTKTGDFAVADANFYGPFEFPSENMNWFIGLGDEDYINSSGGKGQAWVFDVMASPEQVLTKGLPYRKYTIGTNTGFMPGSCHMAYHRVYDQYQLKEETLIVSGTIEIKSLPDGRDEVVVDVIDANGVAHKGSYVGAIGIKSAVNIPMADRHFSGDGARIAANYYGSRYAPENESPEKTEWDITWEDKTLIESGGENGLGISLMIRTSNPTSFEAGLPVGVFSLYEPDQTGVVEGIYNGYYTSYTVFYETERRTLMITGGYITISKVGDGYKIDLELETGNSEVMYRVTGSYTGAVALEDYSVSPWNMTREPLASEKKIVVNALFTK